MSGEQDAMGSSVCHHAVWRGIARHIKGVVQEIGNLVRTTSGKAFSANEAKLSVEDLTTTL
jgi:hypothetical protein